MVSKRRQQFFRLIRQAYYIPSPVLVRNLHDLRFSAVARLACLRILVCRMDSGRPYIERKNTLRQLLGV